MRTRINTLPGRYTPTLINGTIQHKRDKATLQVDAVALLRENGPLPKKKIITALRTVQWLVDEVIEKAEADGQIERFRMLSSRKRMDEFWCITGSAPARTPHKFRGPEILAEFRATARQQLRPSGLHLMGKHHGYE
ncbi:conserved hypothetical protein [Paraburkholderia tropica]